MTFREEKDFLEKQQKNIISGLAIKTKLFIGFVVIILIFLISVSITLSYVSKTKFFITDTLENDLPYYDYQFDLMIEIFKTQSSIRGWLILQDPQLKNDYHAAWTKINKIINKIDEANKNGSNEIIISQWSNVKSLLNDLRVSQMNVENLSLEVDKEKTLSKVKETSVYFNKIIEIYNGGTKGDQFYQEGLFSMLSNELATNNHKILADMRLIEKIEYLVIILGVLASILIAFLTARSITKSINVYRNYSSKVASGDLRQTLSIETQDEMGQLGRDLNSMTEKLAVISKQIIDSCHNMIASIEEVKQSVDVQSSGASEQASSINEITASLEEMEKSSAQTMDRAKSLGEIASKTREKGQQGLDAVQKNISGMNSVRDKVQAIAETILHLSKQTQQAGEITSLVNMLAQQLKMLALNAAIEAAKAGDSGRGFAIVAAEVKNLAEQSEQSITQVQKILENIQHTTEKAVMVTEEGTKGVDYGMALVEETGDIVKELGGVIEEATRASQQIEVAVRQESIGIEQITAGMNEINQVTGAYVQSAKQTTEAINHLRTIANNLKKYIDFYKL